jgi:hypothetical protein
MRRSRRITSEADQSCAGAGSSERGNPDFPDEVARPCPPLPCSFTLLVPSLFRSRRPRPRPPSRQPCGCSVRPRVNTSAGWRKGRWLDGALFGAVRRRCGSGAGSPVRGACAGR